MRDDTIPVPGAADRAVAYGDLTDDLLRTDWWTDAMLARAGVPRAAYDFADGSCMSSYNRVSPRAMATFLR